jgi:hypothetical protein
MPRTTAEDVRLVIEVDAEATPDLTPFILIANELVTEHCSSGGLTETRLKLVETWLAAHFYEARMELATSESAGGASKSYQRPSELFLHQTKHGQTAMMLDSTGNLAALSSARKHAKKIGIAWSGTHPGDEPPKGTYS